MDDEDDDNIDLEELQAQIDLSMAKRQSLVASWVQSVSITNASTSQLKRAKHEQEIEELLRRPARLGVGASVPAPTNIRSLESAKLKGKLIGKKRHHEDDPILISSNSEEEGESRAGAIKKKARIDPFESKKGKGKKKVETSPPPKAQPSATTKIKSGHQNSMDTKGKAAMSAFSAAIAEPMISPRVTSPESPLHKKRKRKNKCAVTTAAQVEPSSSKKDYSAKDDAIVEIIMVQDSPEPMSPAPKRNRLNTPDPMRSPKSVDRDNIDGPTLFGVPLLNLGGPPPAMETTPSRKKRRRKKKKRAHKLAQGTGGDAMDVDDQEVSPIDHSDAQEED